MCAALDQLLGQGAVEHPRQRSLAGAAQYQGRHAVMCGMVEQGIGDAGPMQQLGVATQAPCQREGRIDFASGRVILATALHGHYRPRCVAALGDATRHAHQVFALAATINGHQHTTPQRQVALAASRPCFAQAAVDAVGGLLHRKFAQRGQVGRREECLQGLRGLFGHIDLALLQACDQFAWRQVDQHDVVQAVEHTVRHGLADAHAGDAHHHIVEAFQMLDVDRGPDVDAGVQQLHHILPAPLVAAARRIAVGQFVHQHQRRMPCEHGIQIHLLQRVAVVGHFLQRQLRQAFQQCLGIGTAMGFHQAHHQVDTAAQLFLRAGQHRVGLAHARRRTEEHGQLAASFALQAFDQGIGLAGTRISHGCRCHGRHCARSRCRPASRCLGRVVQCEVQRHHVHPWLPEQTPLASLGMRLQQGLHALHR